jgi:hypothetical protein
LTSLRRLSGPMRSLAAPAALAAAPCLCLAASRRLGVSKNSTTALS